VIAHAPCTTAWPEYLRLVHLCESPLGEQLYAIVIEFNKRTFWCACAATSQACGVSYSATTV
jgi:hypothetical protein